MQVAGFIGLGIFLRIYHFSELDLTNDEYGTWWVIAGGGWGEVARRAVRIQGQSPFFYFLVKLSSDLLGAGTVSFRLPSILFGIGTLGLVYPLAIRIFADRHVALLAVAAFAVNEKLIFFSQDARPYSLALLCAMVSFLCYLSLLTTEKPSSRVGYLLATGGAYYAHYLFGFVAVIQILHLFLIRRWSWMRPKPWGITYLALAVLCLPGGAQVVSLFGRRNALDYVDRPEILAPAKLALEVLNPWVSFPVAAAVLAFVIFGREEAKPRYRGMELLVVWFLSPILFFATVPPLFGISLLNDRYFLVVVLAALLFQAWLMGVVRQSVWSRWVPLVVLFTVTFAWTLIPALRATGTFCQRPNQGWKRAANFLEKHSQAGDLVVYRAGLVEADEFASLNPNPLILSFASWPLTANLSSVRTYEIIGLPHREIPQNAAYLSSVLKKAAESPRVWLIGKGLMDRVAEVFRGYRDFRVRERISYGSVQVILLEQSDRRTR